MRGNPVLREELKGKTRFRAYGGLQYIKGNSLPYFSLTGEEYILGRRDIEMGGCCHEEILKRWPELADLAAMHLSDIDGVPMHAEANGWYHLAGYFPDAFGERYHSGNSERHFSDGYRKPTGDECLAIFAEHCRMNLTDAREVAEQVRRVAMAAPHSRNSVAKAECARILRGMRPRWKQEADACIAKHGLVVFGDNWEPAQHLQGAKA